MSPARRSASRGRWCPLLPTVSGCFSSSATPDPNAPPRRQPGASRHPHRSAGRLWGRECKQMGFYSYLTRVPCASPSPLGTKPPRRLLLLLLQLLPPPIRLFTNHGYAKPRRAPRTRPYAACGSGYTRGPAACFTQCGAISSPARLPPASLPPPRHYENGAADASLALQARPPASSLRRPALITQVIGAWRCLLGRGGKRDAAAGQDSGSAGALGSAGGVRAACAICSGESWRRALPLNGGGARRTPAVRR